MIRYVTGVNCVGGMGRGVALAFKRRFPDNFKGYQDACDRGELQPGRMLVFETGELMPRLVRKSRPAGDACASGFIVFHVTE